MRTNENAQGFTSQIEVGISRRCTVRTLGTATGLERSPAPRNRRAARHSRSSSVSSDNAANVSTSC